MTNEKNTNNNNKNVVQEKKPNDVGGILFSSVIKIYDPNTKEIIVHKRGDN